MQTAHSLAASSSQGRIAVVTDRDAPPREELEADGDITVVATVRHVSELPRVLGRTAAHIAIVGLGSPAGAVYELSRDLRRDDQEHAVVVTRAPFEAESLLDAVEADVRGYVPEGVPAEQLRRAVRAVAAGEVALPRPLIGDMLDLLRQRRLRREQAMRRLWRLTDRERAVLALLMDARSNEAIGKALNISPQTVRKHVQHILTKLDVHSRLEAVTFVHRHALNEQLTAGLGG